MQKPLAWDGTTWEISARCGATRESFEADASGNRPESNARFVCPRWLSSRGIASMTLGERPRFPNELAPAVQAAIKERLIESNIRVGYWGGIRGGHFVSRSNASHRRANPYLTALQCGTIHRGKRG
jgi:hypothetical protein